MTFSCRFVPVPHTFTQKFALPFTLMFVFWRSLIKIQPSWAWANKNRKREEKKRTHCATAGFARAEVIGGRRRREVGGGGEEGGEEEVGGGYLGYREREREYSEWSDTCKTTFTLSAKPSSQCLLYRHGCDSVHRSWSIESGHCASLAGSGSSLAVY